MNKERQLELAQISEARKSLRRYKDDEIFKKINDSFRIGELVSEHFGWEFDGKNFFDPSDQDKKRKGCFVPPDCNFLVQGGTHHLPDDRKGYDCFEFIKTVKGMTGRQAIDWFKSRCPELGQPEVAVHEGSSFEAEVMKLLEVKCEYTWGTEKLDEKMPMLLRGDFVFFPGETGAGKTTFSLFMARQNAAKGLKVLYFSLEMNAAGLVARYARERAGIKHSHIQNGTITEEQKFSYLQAVKELQEVKFLSLPKENTVSAIESVLDESVDLVFIDNFGFLQGFGEQQVVREEEISRDLLALCSRFPRMAMLVLHHWKKGGKKSVSSPRGIEEMKGSSKIGHNAFAVVQYFRNPQALGGECELLINKNRNWGYGGRQKVYYHNGLFYDFPQEVTSSSIRSIF